MIYPSLVLIMLFLTVTLSLLGLQWLVGYLTQARAHNH